MRHRIAALVAVSALLALVLAPTHVARSDGERSLYAEPTAFGPGNVAFPWHAAFSPDGRWAGFADGYTPYVEIWDVTTGKRAWPTDGKARGATHRVSFSADSKQMAFVDGKQLVVLALEGGAWTESSRTTLLEKPPISARTSPLRLDFEPSGLGVVLATGGGAVTVDLTCGCIESIGPSKDVLTTFAFCDGSKAFGLEQAFSTRMLPKKGAPADVPGVLLESDGKGATWLVASDKTQFDVGFLRDDEESHLALEVRDASSATARAKFVLSGRRDASKPYRHRLLIAGRFSPDGRLLATAEGTGSIVLRDAATGAVVQTIHEYEAQAYAMGVAFSPDGKRLITGGRTLDGARCLLWKRAKP